MKTIIDMLLITLVVCFIVDISGVIDSIRNGLARVIYRRTKVKVDTKSLSLKPFSCSLCSTWWCCLIYILITGHFTLPYIAVSAILAMTASNVSGFLLLLKDLLSWLEMKIQKLIL